MIRNSSYKKLMIGVCSFVVIAIIGIVYAAFTGNLNMDGMGVNRKSNYDIYFNNVSNFQTTGTASVTDSNPTVQNHTTVIKDYEATLSTPGDSIYFTFDIVNNGDYDVTLTGLELGPVKCSVNGNESDTSATNVCSNIEYTIKYTDSNSNVSVNDTLASKETKEVKVTLIYKDFSDASKLPTSNVTISNLGIDMIYTADSEAKTNRDGSTPKKRYTIGEEVTVQNEKYNVIGQGSDYLTLLKRQPLTVNEINTYGGVGTENNHVNKYSFENIGTAYDKNGFGGMAYYSSANCGYPIPGDYTFIYDGCTPNYNDSDIKYVVDNWAANSFTNSQLRIVNDYAARLITFEELSQFYSDCSPNNQICNRDSRVPGFIPSPDSGGSFAYWTMTQWHNQKGFVWYVMNESGTLNDTIVVRHEFTVRPVINVYKDSIE